jgi:hypothetical protein
MSTYLSKKFQKTHLSQNIQIYTYDGWGEVLG